MKVIVVVLLREIGGSRELVPLRSFSGGENSCRTPGFSQPERSKDAAPGSALPFWTWFTENPGRVRAAKVD